MTEKCNLAIASCFSRASITVLSNMVRFHSSKSHCTKERAKVANLAEVVLLRTSCLSRNDFADIAVEKIAHRLAGTRDLEQLRPRSHRFEVITIEPFPFARGQGVVIRPVVVINAFR